MCGSETTDSDVIKVEGAELRVCSSCSTHGTVVESEDDSGEQTTKYSTQSSSTSTTDNTSSADTSETGSLDDDLDEIVPDYAERLVEAREAMGIGQAELAEEINEKASRVRKVEQGDVLPSDALRKKLERALDVSLVADAEDASWDEESATSGVTLGDVVRRED